jgi:hypothetical protein
VTRSRELSVRPIHHKGSGAGQRAVHTEPVMDTQTKADYPVSATISQCSVSLDKLDTDIHLSSALRCAIYFTTCTLSKSLLTVGTLHSEAELLFVLSLRGDN